MSLYSRTTYLNYALLIPLNASQLEIRRTQLNQAGYLAYISPALILLPIAHYIYVSPAQTTSSSRPSGLTVLRRRLTWLLSTPLTSEFGSLRVHVLGFCYLGWLLFLIFRGTGHDYMHLTKAFGHVAASQLPWQYLLAVKSRWNPLQLLLHQSHEELNDLHRLFGRIIHLLLASHAALYLNFFVRINVLEKKLKDPIVRLGILTFWTFNFLALLSLPLSRRRFYHALFYRSHVFLSALLLPLLYFHVPYTRTYILQAGALYVLNGFARSLTSSPTVSVTISKITDTNLLHLQADGTASAYLSNWTPGQHIYLKRSNSPLYPKTPFTAVEWPGSPGNRNSNAIISLVVRNLNGPQTAWLASQTTAALHLEGPYGQTGNHLSTLTTQAYTSNSDSVLLVAGGVGVTYTLPLYLALLDRLRSSGAAVKFVWFVRSRAETSWVLDMLHHHAPGDVDVTIYVTGPIVEKTELLQAARQEKRGIKIQHKLHNHRAQVSAIVDGVFAQQKDKSGRTHVFTCGPGSLMAAVRRAVGVHVWRDGQDVVWRAERFGLGSA